MTKEKILYTDSIVEHARFEAPKEPLKGLLAVSYEFYLPRPKRLMRKSDLDGTILCGSRPDNVNLLKGTEDALTKAGFWEDDAQVCCHFMQKFYCEKEGFPRIEVEIRQLTTSVN